MKFFLLGKEYVYPANDVLGPVGVIVTALVKSAY